VKARYWIAATLWTGLACAAWAAANGAPDNRLTGSWRLDATASDNFEAQLTTYLAQVAKLQRRPERRRDRRPPTEAEAAASLGDEIPDEPMDAQRTRLADALRPAQSLAIAFTGSVVALSADGESARSMPLDETMIRIDASGSAQVVAHAASGALTVSHRYLGSTRQTQQYLLQDQGTTLQVTLTYYERSNNKLTVRSLYRRAPQGL
jgi:hypothetical protein